MQHESEEVRLHGVAEEFLKDHNPADEDEYFKIKTEVIKKGGCTWMIRNFDSPGQYYDYWVDGRIVGAIHRSENTVGYEAYFGEQESSNFHTLGEAVEAVEEYAAQLLD